MKNTVLGKERSTEKPGNPARANKQVDKKTRGKRIGGSRYMLEGQASHLLGRHHDRRGAVIERWPRPQ